MLQAILWPISSKDPSHVEYGAILIAKCSVGYILNNLHIISQMTWLFISATVIISDLHQFSLKTEYNIGSCLT
jgi:hypothetical protein